MDAYERLVHESAPRQDILNPANVEALCSFQRWVESQPGCNYTAVRVIMFHARHKEEKVTLPQLQLAYRVYINPYVS